MSAVTEHPMALVALIALAAAIVGLWFTAVRHEFDERLDAYLG